MGTFSGEKCGPCLQFLFTVWKFHENPSKSRYGFLHSSSTSLIEVFKWLNSFSPMVNNLGCQDSKTQMFLVGFAMTTVVVDVNKTT